MTLDWVMFLDMTPNLRCEYNYVLSLLGPSESLNGKVVLGTPDTTGLLILL